MTGFSCFCAGYLWGLHPDCYMPWPNGIFIYWNPCQRNSWMVWYNHINLKFTYVLLTHDILNICPEFVNSGGGFVSGYLPFLPLYLLWLWYFVQRVLIGYTRLIPNAIYYHFFFVTNSLCLFESLEIYMLMKLLVRWCPLLLSVFVLRIQLSACLIV